MNSNPINGAALKVQVTRPDGNRTLPHKSVVPLNLLPVRILLVDDEPLVVGAAASLLKRLGYLVTACTSSIKARQVFSENPQEFDLVITDMSMPLMSGLELAADLVKLRPDLPIILCTGGGGPICLEVARQAGIREILLKPANIQEIAESIQRLLDYQEG